MVLDRVQSGEYASTAELINAAVRDFLKQDHVATRKPRKLDQRSLELAKDAPANLEWIERNREEYMGEWVALYKGKLIAHGKDDMEVFQAAMAQGINPLMHLIVPEDPFFWAGWL